MTLKSLILIPSFAVAAFAAGCGASASSQAHGSATYAKPSSQGGQPVPPQQNQTDMSLTIAIDGSGTFTSVQSTACTLTSGSLSESATSSGTLSSDGSYVSAFSSESASGSGTTAVCGTLKDVKLTSVTNMTVQATIPSNSPNCQGYCNATAASQCQGSADPNCTSSATSTCSAQCSTSSKITGHGSLQSSDMADTNSKLGSSSGDVNAKVDLVFDSLQ